MCMYVYAYRDSVIPIDPGSIRHGNAMCSLCHKWSLSPAVCLAQREKEAKEKDRAAQEDLDRRDKAARRQQHQQERQANAEVCVT